MAEVDGNAGNSGIVPGNKRGMWGDSDTGYWVVGTSNNFIVVAGISNSSTGVQGNSTNGFGVVGDSQYIGVYGLGAYVGVSGDEIGGMENDTGVYGHSSSGTGVVGVTEKGTRVSADGTTGVVANGGSTGVLATGGGIGVYGNSSAGTGVSGSSEHSYGILGTSDNFVGIQANSSNSYGLAAAAGNVPIYAHNTVYGVGGKPPGNDAYLAAPEYSRDFHGDVLCRYNLWKSGGGFKIDHPIHSASSFTILICSVGAVAVVLWYYSQKFN
jgi:hypothetical protein